MKYNDLFSKTAKNAAPSAIRALQPFLKMPDMMNLGGGMPNPQLFPFASISVDLKPPLSGRLELSGSTLNAALQYSGSRGLPDLLERLRQLQMREHFAAEPAAGADFALIVGTGSQDLLDKAFHVLLDPGTPILVENPTYSGALASLRGLGARPIFVDSDEDGLSCAHLRQLLESGAPEQRPRILYTIPTGQNPSGGTTPLHRRRAVLELAQQFDLLVLEDDPYRFLYYGQQAQPASYLSLDTDGRVLRFDSLSKVVSSGIRFGWATGPEPLIAQLELLMQSSSLHSSGLAQTLVGELLAHWGADGWTAHVAAVQQFYRRRRDLMMDAVQRHLIGPGLAALVARAPEAGMFLFLRLPEGLTADQLFTPATIVEHKIIAVGGGAFSPTANDCFRVAFSVIPEEQMDEAVRRLAQLIEAHRHPNRP